MTKLELKLLKALKHAECRLNEIPHKYADTDFKMIRAAIEAAKAEDGELAGHDTVIQVCRNALADLEGVMPEIDPSGDKVHPGWRTIRELKTIIKQEDK
jgi:hypothetical protein